MPVRAKFRCDSITLQRTSCWNPDVVEVLDADHPTWNAIRDKADELGVVSQVDFDQPTVALSPVTGGLEAGETPEQVREERAEYISLEPPA